MKFTFSEMKDLNLCPQLDMGIYLSAPKTDKVSEDGENDRLRFGASSMQGWRSTMEDAVSLFDLLVYLFLIYLSECSQYFCLVMISLRV